MTADTVVCCTASASAKISHASQGAHRTPTRDLFCNSTPVSTKPKMPASIHVAFVLVGDEDLAYTRGHNHAPTTAHASSANDVHCTPAACAVGVADMACRARATPPHANSTLHTTANVTDGGADGVVAGVSRRAEDALVALEMPKDAPTHTAAAAMHTPATVPGLRHDAHGVKNAELMLVLQVLTRQ